jgi:uncharacterized damage-inducible protein DinB
MLVVDQLWFGRLTGEKFLLTGLDAELEADRAALRAKVLDFARGWHPYVERLTKDEIAGDVTYKMMSGETRTLPRAGIALSNFNHATHHRGQVTAALTRMQAPSPEMCLPYFLIEQPTTELHG